MTARSTRRLAWCLPFAFAAVALACAGGPATVPPVKGNEELKLHDSVWAVIEAKDLGQLLRSTEGDAPELRTQGRYVLVRYAVRNPGRRRIDLDGDPQLIDGRQRFFDPIGNQEAYLPKGAVTMGDVESDQIPAGLTKEFHALYEVPADARGLRLEAKSFTERFGREQTGHIELGL